MNYQSEGRRHLEDCVKCVFSKFCNHSLKALEMNVLNVIGLWVQHVSHVGYDKKKLFITLLVQNQSTTKEPRERKEAATTRSAKHY